MSVKGKHVVTMRIFEESARVAEKNARIASKGGSSSVRYDNERAERLFIDNLVGQLGMMAASRFFHGHFGDYLANQFYANLYRNSGDGGHDFTGLNLDVKAARFIEGGGRDLLDYRLAVHVREWHAGWVYLLAVVELDERLVHLVGWATAEDFPEHPLPPTEDRFKESYVLAGRDLNRLPPFVWNWFPQPDGG